MAYRERLGMSGETMSRIRFAWGLSPAATVALAVAVIVVVVLLYGRMGQTLTRSYRLALAGLRLLALAALAWLFTDPVLERLQTDRSRIVVLGDVSGSMGTADTGNDQLPRIAAWRQWLLAGDESIADRLANRYRVTWWAVDNQLRDRVDVDRSTPDAFASWKEVLERQRTPERGDPALAGRLGSHLGDAVVDAVEGFAGALPAAVMVLTDGINTGGRSIEEAAERLAELGVGLYLVAVGRPTPRVDLVVESMVAQPIVFVGDRLPIEVSVRCQAQPAEQVEVRLEEVANGEVVDRAHLRWDGTHPEQKVGLMWAPTRTGSAELRVVVDPLPGEERVENNERRLTIDVRTDPIRVLLVDSRPRYEFRALKSLLERDPAIKLQVYLQEADPGFAQVDPAALEEFPRGAEAISSFDVLILGDVDPDLLPTNAWSDILDQVTHESLGLLLIAGPRFMPARLSRLESLRTLLPVEGEPIEGNRVGSAMRRDGEPGYRVRCTLTGEVDPMLRLGSTPDESVAVWQQLPPLQWVSVAQRVKPAAEVLAVVDTSENDPRDSLPLVVRQWVGGGEVLWIATDETWRWRWRNDDRYFARFWGQAVRRLARGHLARGRSQLWLDRTTFQTREPITVRAWHRGETALPGQTGLMAELTGESSPTQRIELVPRLGQPQLYEAVLPYLAAGQYAARLVTGEGAQQTRPVRFEVQAPVGEWQPADIPWNQLQAAATRTGGQAVWLADAADLFERLPAPSEVIVKQESQGPLLGTHWPMGVLVVALTLEWILRRRASLP
jgi:hypothetical protein